jgi:hypothetical protein
MMIGKGKCAYPAAVALRRGHNGRFSEITSSGEAEASRFAVPKFESRRKMTHARPASA